MISSRTPEGLPWRCPMCGSDVRMEPSWPIGDATCPRCGTLLWPKLRRPSLRIRPYRWLLKVLLVLLAFGALVCIPLGVLLGLMVLAATHPFGLYTPEIVVLLILGVLLFGRKLPNVARYLGSRYP